MPTTRPLTPCTVGGCPGRSRTGGPCPRHAAQRARARGGSTAQGYGPDWFATRTRYLRTHPWCVLCGHPASVADHWPRTRRQLVRDRVADPNAWVFLRPLCDPCHRSYTGTHQPGGWHARHLT